MSGTTQQCQVPGCQNKPQGRGLCFRHHKARKQPMTVTGKEALKHILPSRVGQKGGAGGRGPRKAKGRLGEHLRGLADDIDAIDREVEGLVKDVSAATGRMEQVVKGARAKAAATLKSLVRSRREVIGLRAIHGEDPVEDEEP